MYQVTFYYYDGSDTTYAHNVSLDQWFQCGSSNVRNLQFINTIQFIQSQENCTQ